LDHRAHTLTPARPLVRQSAGRRRATPAVFYLGLASVELAWLLWFLIVPLPNANPLGTPARSLINRGWLLLKTFPEVIPDTRFKESYLGQALEELSHIENLPQRIPILLTAGLIALAAIGLGDLVLRGLRLQSRLSLGERIALGFGLGAALLGVVTLIVGRLGWLNPWLIRVGLGLTAMAGLGTARPWQAFRRVREPTFWLPGLVVAPFVAVMILGSMLPAIDFDVLEYHLQGPKEYFQTGQITFLPHNVYTNMPFGVEMLHLLAMEVMGDWWWGALAGQLLVALFAPAAAMLIAATAYRAGSARAAWIAAIVYLSTPWIYRLAVIAYVEGPLCFFHAALVWAAVWGVNDRSVPRRPLWGLLGLPDDLCETTKTIEVPRRPLWILVGLLAGGAMSCKYPALISAVIPFGVLALVDAWRRRSPSLVLCYMAGWVVVIGPWLGKNVRDTGNPVYPLGNSIFHGRYWDQARETKWVGAHGRRTVNADELWSAVVDVAGRSDWQSPLYVALAPLALLRPRSRRLVLALWGFVAYLFLTWWLLTHRLDRFWLPLLPSLAVLAGLGADWVRSRGWSILLGAILTIGLVMNFTYISTALSGLNEWTGNLVFLRRNIPQRLNAPLAALDKELPDSARVLLVGQAAIFHLQHRVDYNTVFNEETIEILAARRTPEQLRQALQERQLTHIYVDWKEIQRHRQPGGYGFTDFVTPARFADWVAAGVLDRAIKVGPEQEYYPIRLAPDPRFQ
jgi:4-amino-4-deoxy-L-arabinose transferase-like glycosyltransferase